MRPHGAVNPAPVLGPMRMRRRHIGAREKCVDSYEGIVNGNGMQAVMKWTISRVGLGKCWWRGSVVMREVAWRDGGKSGRGGVDDGVRD